MRGKRTFDVSVAALGLLLTAPLWPILALAIRLGSAGPVLHRARRVGRDGVPFTMLKFRTMREIRIVHAPTITCTDDPRVTPIGRLLRATKLDELPQLWNVLRGEMSVVGPRPEVAEYVGAYDDRQYGVLALRPGITGPAQIVFRHEERLLTARDVERQYRDEILPQKIEMDLQYVATHTLLGDVRLLFRTALHLVRRPEEDRLRRFMDRQVLERVRLHGWTFARDAVVIVGAYALGLCVRFDMDIPATYMRAFLVAAPFIVAVYGLNTYLFGIHRRIWRYAGMADLQAIVVAVALSTVLVAIAESVFPGQRAVPLSVVIAGGTFGLTLLIAVRLWLPLSPFRGSARSTPESWSEIDVERVIIVGAGHAGQLLVRDLRAHRDARQVPVGFVDDDPRKQHMTIQGVPVAGLVGDLPRVTDALRADVIGIAVPSATPEQLDRFLTLAQETEARIQILPSLAEITTGKASVRLRSIRLEELLDRSHFSTSRAESDRLDIPPDGVDGHGDTISADREALDWLEDRVVLVTGGAGSIGSELCKQLKQLRPRRVVALDNNETALFHLDRDVEEIEGAPLIPVLADITDVDRLQRVFQQHGPDIVFHAAAYKHVPMLEVHPHEAVVVNVVGTQNLCRLAVANRCERFVFISTDKAVEPQNVLGYSKRIGELLVQAHATNQLAAGNDGGTRFSSVRFGNVIGSRGSALPEFIRQIDEGGPVTVTHPDMERYFMTISEAASLVIQAAAVGDDTLFMLDMGNPIRILDLVHRLIRLRGLRAGKDIEIIHTGLRPGEKMTEELSFSDEQARQTSVPRILALHGTACPGLDELEYSIARLRQVARHDEPEAVIAALAHIASGEMTPGEWKLEPAG